MRSDQWGRRSFVRMAGALLGAFGIGTTAREGTSAPPRAGRSGARGDEDIPLYVGHRVHDGLVYVSGRGAHYDGDIRQHTDTVLQMLEEELVKAGSSMEQVLKVNVYLADLADYDAMNEVYRGRFGDNPPVRTTVATYHGVPGGSLVEIDCIAALD